MTAHYVMLKVHVQLLKKVVQMMNLHVMMVLVYQVHGNVM